MAFNDSADTSLCRGIEGRLPAKLSDVAARIGFLPLVNDRGK